MRYLASEKLEIVRLVEQSRLSARRTLDQLGIPRRTFYRWCDRFREGGPEALEDRPSAPGRVWNPIPAHEMWHTDFTCFKIIGWGRMYLSTVLDAFSRYIIA